MRNIIILIYFYNNFLHFLTFIYIGHFVQKMIPFTYKIMVTLTV